MNYERIYSELIFRAKNRSPLPHEYVEEHHILPKSTHPEFKKEKWNLVKLFPEEHLVAHLLLVKINPNDDSLIYAANMMTNGCNHKNLNRPKYNNKKYAWLKRKHSYVMTNRVISDSQRKMQSELWKKNNPMFSKLVRDKVSKANIGKKLTKSTKDKISKSKLGATPWNKGEKCPSLSGKSNPFYGHKHSDESKIKISNTKRNQWEEKSMEEKLEYAKKFSKRYKIISPENIIYFCDYGLKHFAYKHNLGIKALISSCKNNRPVKRGASKGWIVKEV